MIAGLSRNWGLSIAIKEFDLSGNTMDASTSELFCTWIKHMGKESKMQRLAVAHTSLVLADFFDALDLARLVFFSF